MKKALFLILVMTFANIAFTQEVQDFEGDDEQKITINENSYYKHGIKLTYEQLKLAVFKNEESRALMSKAKSDASIASVFGYLGGFCIGYPLGQAIGGHEEVKWGVAGVGAGLLLIAIPIATGANKKVKKAVKIYNKSLDESSDEREVALELAPTQHGVGLVFRF